MRFDAQGMEDMDFYQDNVWHEGTKEELRVGGLLSVPGGVGQLVYYDYDCLVRNERLINVNF